MRRRSFKELKPLWDTLSKNTFMTNEFVFEGASFITKWSNVVMDRLYPDYPAEYTHTLSGQGEFMDEWGKVDRGDLGIHTHATWSPIVDMCFHYLKASPHWSGEVRQVIAGVVEPDLEEEGCEKMAKMIAYHGYYFQDLQLTESGEALLLGLYELFDGAEYEDTACGDDYYIITTPLYFYAKKLMELAGGEYEEEVSYLKKAFDALKSMYCGDTFEAEVGDVSYFICTDGAGGDCPNTEMGCFDYEETALIAAEMAEAIIFELDAFYNVLPELLRVKDRKWQQEVMA